MAETIKNTYSIFFFEQLCAALKVTFPEFEEREFIYRVFDEQWPDLALQQRAKHVIQVLHDFLPLDYSQAAALLEGHPDTASLVTPPLPV